jgi:hypothetical protein
MAYWGNTLPGLISIDSDPFPIPFRLMNKQVSMDGVAKKTGG